MLCSLLRTTKKIKNYPKITADNKIKTIKTDFMPFDCASQGFGKMR